MISAYFDDSGTHDESKVVLVAGIFGTEARMENLDRNWKQHLAAPLDGRKEAIKRFHAYDCDQSTGEFTRWTRTETDYFRHQLRTVIIESEVAAYGLACSRRDYDKIIKGNIRSVLGTPEGFCINQCFVRSLAWVQRNTFDPQMKYVFDNRPAGVQRYAGTVYDAFAQWVDPPPRLAGYSFLSSFKIRPLQAADLVAWELNRYAHDILKHGLSVKASKELLHLRANMDIQAQFASAENIKKLRDYWVNYFKDNPDHLKQMANHFDLFDPSAPNYSLLTQRP
jgi:hypothetical protein